MRIIAWFKNAIALFQNDFITEPFYLEKENTMKAVSIQKRGDRYILFANGEVVSGYARERDARRGAIRRGFAVA